MPVRVVVTLRGSRVRFPVGPDACSHLLLCPAEVGPGSTFANVAAVDDRRFLDVPGRSGVGFGGDRDDVVVWCRGPVEQHTSAVLLLHDRASNARSWDLVMGRLPSNVAVVALDLRGRGSAWRQAPSSGIATHVDDLNDVLDRLDIDEVLAVGHGFGAVVASELAKALPDRVALTVGIVNEIGDDPFDSVIGIAFPDRNEHLRFWQRHPRFADADARAIESFVTHGIAGPEDHHRWRVDLRSLVADDQDSRLVGQLRFSRSITIAPIVGASIGATTHLPHLDPAVALLTSAGADAITAQIQHFLG